MDKQRAADAVRTALEVGRYLLAAGEVGTDDLPFAMGISGATARRAIVELRGMGADIRTMRGPGGSVYVWRNADACKLRLWTWLGFIEEHCLITPGG